MRDHTDSEQGDLYFHEMFSARKNTGTKLMDSAYLGVYGLQNCEINGDSQSNI